MKCSFSFLVFSLQYQFVSSDSPRSPLFNQSCLVSEQWNIHQSESGEKNNVHRICCHHSTWPETDHPCFISVDCWPVLSPDVILHPFAHACSVIQVFGKCSLNFCVKRRQICWFWEFKDSVLFVWHVSGYQSVQFFSSVVMMRAEPTESLLSVISW